MDNKEKKSEFKVDPSRFMNVKRLSSFRRNHPIFETQIRPPQLIPSVPASVPIKGEVKKEKPSGSQKRKQKKEKKKKETASVSEQSFKPRRNIRLFNNTVERPSGMEKKKRPPKLEVHDTPKVDEFLSQYSNPPLGVDSTPKTKVDEKRTTSPIIGKIADNVMEDDQLYFVQFPYALPVKKSKKKAKKKKKSIGQMEYQEDFWSTVFPNKFENKQGRLGKLFVYKSGKTKLLMGETLFDVNKGTKVNFGEDVVKLDKNEQKCCFLGKIQKRLVCSPDLDELI